MDLKWFEDLRALAQTGSLTRAAASRHVTHPAFGRRLRALEAWAGVSLIERNHKPVRLTSAGQRLLAQAEHSVLGLLEAREELRQAASAQSHTLTVATGRTLARTWVADWAQDLRRQHKPGLLRVRTAALADTLRWLEQGEADLMVAYHHPSIAERPQGRAFLQKTVAHDRLVPVARRAPAASARTVPFLAYAPSLALAGLVADHLLRQPAPQRLQPVLECDSADALLEYALKGMGLCWLPWSLAGQACRQGQLVACWDGAMEIPFEVRLVRLRRRLGELAEAAWLSTPSA